MRHERLMKILKFMKQIPGGLFVVPMFAAATVHTLFPGILQIGGPSQALFSNSSTMVLVGLMLFFAGLQMKRSQAVSMLKGCGAICVLKLAITFGVCFIVQHLTGMKGIGGVSLLALTAALSNANPALYAETMSVRGNAVDMSGIGILSIITVPAIPVLMLTFAEGYGIDYRSVVSVMLPFLLGALLGNLDKELSAFFSAGTTLMIPFMGLAFGSTINLITALQAGLGGVFIVIFYYIFGWLPLFIIERRMMKRSGYISTSMSALGGLCLAVPVLAIQVQPAFEIYRETATAQLACAIVITAILTPILINWLDRKTGYSDERKSVYEI